MKEAFILRRPGLLIVSGNVTNIQRNKITLVNVHDFPISGPDNVEIILNVPEDVVSNMRIKRNAFLIASTSDNFLVEMLEEGGETPNRVFELNAFTLRYNGSFDFDPYGDKGEEHVLSGTLTAAKQRGVGKDGKAIWQALISWKRHGEEEKHQIVYHGNEKLDQKLNSRVIFVTGEKKEYGGQPYFESKILFDF